ncbi:uncharacterized protein LOC110118789 isoform X2 [Ceratitis capitata]|uniref:uncharacterized protein LOC110118789 isoform X2 n=1 Tax=Ceratitis capitata TaxID=7213 RepID=UPI000A1107D9|nr:uncharacterized protein LOC110118789 isoform X2 [Ceratitis capitata]
MDLSWIKFKKYLNVLKIRLFVAEVVSIPINIFNLDYNGNVFIVKRNTSNHHKRIFRKILIYIIILNIAFTISYFCGASFMRVYFPEEFNHFDTTGNMKVAQHTAVLLMCFSGFKYLTTLCLLKNWLNNRNGKILESLLNELISMCQSVCKHSDFEFNRMPPQCSLIFHMQLILTVRIIMEFCTDFYYASICFMYQTMILVLWNLHFNVNKYFEMSVKCKVIKRKNLLTFLNLMQGLKNAQRDFVNHFLWLPCIQCIKAFLLIAESSCFWNYLHQRNLLAEIKLDWLYCDAFLCWLDLYLLSFSLKELYKLYRHSQHQLFIEIIRESDQQYLTAAFILDHHLKPYTNCLLLNAQHTYHWTLLTPLAFGYIMSYINPIDLSYLQMLGQ